MKRADWLGFYWKDLFSRIGTKETNRLEFLKNTAFFQGFTPTQISLTAEFLHERKFAANEHIFEIGHPGAALYFVTEGEVSIEIPGESTVAPVQLAKLSKGSFFGEMALIDDAPRSASARAETEVTVLALPRSELESMLQQTPFLGGLVFKALAQITSSRMKATLERMTTETRSLKVANNG